MLDRRFLAAFLVPVLIGLLATGGLASPSWSKIDNPTTVTVVILGGVELNLEAGDYSFGSYQCFPPPDLTRTVTLEARSNMSTYKISMYADEILRDGLATMEILPDNLVYTAYPAGLPPVSGSLPIGAGNSTIIIGNGTATASTLHEVDLHLTGLDGNERAGYYSSTVHFTISTP